jgi:glucose-1-phosphate thymidylyltransferase
MAVSRITRNCVGLIPAAGKGARLGLPYPKELYPLVVNNAYKPIAQFAVEALVEADIKHIVLVIDETKHQLIGYFRDGKQFRCQTSYVVQHTHDKTAASSSPGLALALNSAYHLTAGYTVLFAMADTIMRPKNIFSVLLDALTPDVDFVMGLFPTNRPEKFGMVDIDERNVVRRVIDKPRETDLTYMWGCIVWQPAFTEHLHNAVGERGELDFANILGSAISSGMTGVGVPICNGAYYDIGTYDELTELLSSPLFSAAQAGVVSS